jgi:hypothetical protein
VQQQRVPRLTSHRRWWRRSFRRHCRDGERLSRDGPRGARRRARRHAGVWRFGRVPRRSRADPGGSRVRDGRDRRNNGRGGVCRRGRRSVRCRSRFASSTAESAVRRRACRCEARSMSKWRVGTGRPTRASATPSSVVIATISGRRDRSRGSAARAVISRPRVGDTIALSLRHVCFGIFYIRHAWKR